MFIVVGVAQNVEVARLWAWFSRLYGRSSDIGVADHMHVHVICACMHAVLTFR